MIIASAFFIIVFFYSLISERLRKTVITPPMLFTAGGVALVLALPGVREIDVERQSMLKLAELGLVMLLFTDASRINLKSIRSPERVQLRLLTVGMLLTILLGALAARVIFPTLSLWEAGILGAILAPTDAGLGEVIVQSPRVPKPIRQALNVEAGLNDGLSVPFLMFFIAEAKAVTEGGGAALLRYLFEQLVMGGVAGGGAGLIGGVLLGLACRRGWMAEPVQQLGFAMVPILAMIACIPVGGSVFIAAFCAGLTVQVGFRDAGPLSIEFTEGWGQLFGYFVFFFLGLVGVFSFSHFNMSHLVYAVASLTAVRMLPVALSLAGTGLSAATVLFIGWFGPRGLASIVLGLVFLEQEAHLPGEETIRLAVIVTVLLSIFLHGASATPGIELYAGKEAKSAAVAEKE
ncbi:cation:proton antiporter [Geomonas sp. RF6]|uniref:cation:proton antiporter n=1 Tax=Geomonas sp. RF6 TaxID=2897342 RepID=UPI001E344156|nr:cation:proton antiporter [Geomonas sp. RF6]UFS70660.1 cation:proton antiporter [Geomonas sp. RF6]